VKLARVGETRIDLWRGKDRHLTEVSPSTPAAVAEMPTYLSELRAESRTARSVGGLHARLELSSHLRLSVSALWDIQNTSYVLPPI